MTDNSHQMHQDRAKLPERVELARRTHGEGQDIILVFLPHNRATPFVTWFEGADGNTYWGHYHDNLAAALKGYESR